MKRKDFIMLIKTYIIDFVMELKRGKVSAIIWACVVFAVMVFLLVSLSGEMSEERWVRIGF